MNCRSPRVITKKRKRFCLKLHPPKKVQQHCSRGPGLPTTWCNMSHKKHSMEWHNAWHNGWPNRCSFSYRARENEWQWLLVLFSISLSICRSAVHCHASHWDRLCIWRAQPFGQPSCLGYLNLQFFCMNFKLFAVHTTFFDHHSGFLLIFCSHPNLETKWTTFCSSLGL